MLNEQIELLDAALKRVVTLIPGVPKEELLIGRIIVLLGRDISALMDRTVRPHGLTESGWRVLAALFFQPGSEASPGEMAATVADSPANMTRIADGLVAQGFITRELSAQDRRRMVLRMTAAGGELVSRLLPTVFGLVRQIFSGLSSTETEKITSRLKRVAVELDSMDPHNPEESP